MASKIVKSFSCAGCQGHLGQPFSSVLFHSFTEVKFTYTKRHMFK